MNKIEPLLRVEGVSQIYVTKERRFVALRKVDLAVDEGEFVAILGPTGSGKSTLLRIITGLQRQTEGTVFYRGESLVGINPHAALVFQTFALFPWLTVLENVEVALKARGVPAGVRTAQALDLLDRVGLDGFENAYPRELSGGMRQKVGFARAMAVEPELLCLDEPFSALDALSADALRGELLELWTGGRIPTKAILMVTHNIEEAIFMADRLVIMQKDPGRVVADIKVPLEHPRDRTAPSFLRMVDRVYAILAGQTMPERIELGTAPGEPGRTRALPHITVDGLIGLLEYLSGAPERQADIYRLPEELQVDPDRLLDLMEGAELLGFVSISRGDVQLTPLGETFAEASILARKEIFASRIRRLPIFNWLLALLQVAERRRLRRSVVIAALQLDFPRDEAERQLDTAIDWGRYAEVFAYDDDAEVLYLEAVAEAA